jgi:hypothetical protein
MGRRTQEPRTYLQILKFAMNSWQQQKHPEAAEFRLMCFFEILISIQNNFPYESFCCTGVATPNSPEAKIDNYLLISIPRFQTNTNPRG